MLVTCSLQRVCWTFTSAAEVVAVPVSTASAAVGVAEVIGASDVVKVVSAAADEASDVADSTAEDADVADSVADADADMLELAPASAPSGDGACPVQPIPGTEISNAYTSSAKYCRALLSLALSSGCSCARANTPW